MRMLNLSHFTINKWFSITPVQKPWFDFFSVARNVENDNVSEKSFSNFIEWNPYINNDQ